MYNINEINKIIRGIIKFKKCPSCDKEGISLTGYDMNGNPSNDKDSCFDECEDCCGLGFIEIQ